MHEVEQIQHTRRSASQGSLLVSSRGSRHLLGIRGDSEEDRAKLGHQGYRPWGIRHQTRGRGLGSTGVSPLAMRGVDGQTCGRTPNPGHGIWASRLKGIFPAASSIPAFQGEGGENKVQIDGSAGRPSALPMELKNAPCRLLAPRFDSIFLG